VCDNRGADKSLARPGRNEANVSVRMAWISFGALVKWSRYRPGVAQRVGRGIALLFHDRCTRRWVVSSTPRPHFTPGKDPVPILQEAGWAPGPVWTGGKSRPHRDSIPERPARSQSLYRLSYPAHPSAPCLPGKRKLDDSSRLDVVEIARVPDMLPRLFPSWSG